MNSSGPTLADLFKLTEGTAQGAGIRYLLAQDHEARNQAVQKAVDFACNQLEQHKHRKQGLSEDAITLEICQMLNASGFQAIHDGDIGGHCDIVVRGKDDFLWLAEAKEHNSYDWLDKGFKQLSTRYSTGVPGQDHGEILIYCYVQNALAMLTKWREELESRHAMVSISVPVDEPLLFHSTHKHDSSGLDFYIRHKAIALYWSPRDK